MDRRQLLQFFGLSAVALFVPPVVVRPRSEEDPAFVFSFKAVWFDPPQDAHELYACGIRHADGTEVLRFVAHPYSIVAWEAPLDGEIVVPAYHPMVVPWASRDEVHAYVMFRRGRTWWAQGRDGDPVLLGKPAEILYDDDEDDEAWEI